MVLAGNQTQSQRQHGQQGIHAVQDPAVAGQQATAVLDPRGTLEQGFQQITHDASLFAGSKRNEILVGYQDRLQIDKFDLAIDWGERFWIFTRPLFAVLEFFNSHVGNFGLAIMLLTAVLTVLLTMPLMETGRAATLKDINI
jgi:membrane protein insertase Oxa1/YidC/SpoIIIJ